MSKPVNADNFAHIYSVSNVICFAGTGKFLIC